MAINLLVGLSTMVVCLAIQCVAVEIIFRALLAGERRQAIKPTLGRTSLVLTTVMLIMLLGNLVQIVVWAGLFVVCSEFEQFTTAFYHSVVNFATLGYGDIVMSEDRRLLGGLEALNGVLMIGLSTGVLFSVLNDLINQAWATRTTVQEDA